MTRRLLISYLTLTALVLVILETPLGITFTRSERRNLLNQVAHDAATVGTLVEDTLEHGTAVPAPGVAAQYAERTGGRIVVVDVNGRSVVDTGSTSAGRDFSTRPEIRTALRGDRATGFRPSETLGYDIAYAAVPVASGGKVHGAVRITYPAAALERRIRSLWTVLALVGAVVLAAVSVVGWQLARSVSRPLRALEATAEALAQGHLDVRANESKGPHELRTLAATFNQTAGRLVRLLSAQREFVADASHELRTPLTALRLRLENLESSVAPEDRAELESAVREAARLSGIVDNLLLLARAEGTATKAVPVEVGAAVAERLPAWEPEALERGVRLEQAPGGAQWVRVVPGQLDQMVDNLLANAVAVSPAGSTVTAAVTRDADHVEMHVLDRGAGLPDDELDRAFERFWRGPRSAGQGAGLGLAIVRQLAVANGGKAVLRHRDGGGLDAVVRLRAVPPPG